MKVTVILIVIGALGTVTKGLVLRLADLEIKEQKNCWIVGGIFIGIGHLQIVCKYLDFPISRLANERRLK